MRRRDFVKVLASGAVAWPLAVRAQQAERMRRIGVLMLYPESDPQGQLRANAFQQGLQKLGWVGEVRPLGQPRDNHIPRRGAECGNVRFKAQPRISK